MDFLNKAYAQLADLFRSMTIGARITTGLLLVTVVVSLVYLFQFRGAAPDTLLMGGEKFTPSELDSMEAAFASANLHGAQRDSDNRIRVPRGQQAKYMAALADKKALPNNAFRYLEEAVNNQNSFLDDQKTRERRDRNGMLRTVSDIIKQMKGIDKATVICDYEDISGLIKKRVKTASVAVSMKGSANLEEEHAAHIRRMVEHAMAMKYEQVVVTDLSNGRQFWGNPNTGSGDDDPVIRKTRDYEKQFRQKVLDLLSATIKNVVVSVGVQLDPQEENRVTAVKYDPKPIAISIQETSSSKTLDGSGPGGIAGIAANQAASVNTGRPPQGKSGRNEEEKSDRKEQNALGSTQTVTTTAPHTLKKVSVSVRVPMSHFESIWRTQNPTPPGETPKKPLQADIDPIRTAEIAKVRKSIEPLIAISDTAADLTKLIDVSDYQDIAGEPIPETPASSKALDWLAENWTTLAIAGLALVGMVMLRSMLRADARSPVEMAVAATKKAGAGSATVDEAQVVTAAERRLKRLTGSGKSLREELSELVNEDPDLAANILRTWIGNVV